MGARAPPAMAALAARLREHLPAALWRELEPLLEALPRRRQLPSDRGLAGND